MHPASTLAAPPTYQRHRPERTVLYSIISEHYPRFVQEIERSGGHLPQFVRQEFDEYLKCGLLEHGISTFLIRRTGFTVASGVKTGAVTLIQRFGSALNLNPHLHMLFLDGVYRLGGNAACFHRARRATHDQLVQLWDRLSRRIVRVLERRGLLVADAVDPFLELNPGSSLDQIQAASINYRIAIGPHAGRKALTLYIVPPLEE